ncbi:hypothetical protein HHE02_09940 [Helicobacter heilmannii]|nr:hypothetical protein HHE02_09940 [Helicobacter heilmannii]
MECYDHDKLAHWKEKREIKGVGTLSFKTERYPPSSFHAFQARIAPVWYKPRYEGGLNIRLHDFLGKDLPQIDTVAVKNDWGLMRETKDCVASLNRRKLREMPEKKGQQYRKRWYYSECMEQERQKQQKLQEQSKQPKISDQSPSKGKMPQTTPKPTEPQKDQQQPNREQHT